MGDPPFLFGRVQGMVAGSKRGRVGRRRRYKDAPPETVGLVRLLTCHLQGARTLVLMLSVKAGSSFPNRYWPQTSLACLRIQRPLGSGPGLSKPILEHGNLRLLLRTVSQGVESNCGITSTQKILKWCVKTPTQFCFPPEKNPLEIKAEMFATMRRLLLPWRLLFRLLVDFVSLDEAGLQGEGGAVRPLGGDLPTFITSTLWGGLPLAFDKNWNLITAAAHLLRFLG